MDLKRTWITMLAFLLVAVIVWVGFSIYFSVNNSTLNPNASSYTNPLNPKFNIEIMKEISDRVDDLPVKDSEFKILLEE